MALTIAVVASAIGFALIGLLAVRAALVSSALLVAAARIVWLGVAGGSSATLILASVPPCRHRSTSLSASRFARRSPLLESVPLLAAPAVVRRWQRLPIAIRPCCALGFALVRESDRGRSSRRSSTRPHLSPMPRRRGIASCLIAWHRSPRNRRVPPRDAPPASLASSLGSFAALAVSWRRLGHVLLDRRRRWRGVGGFWLAGGRSGRQSQPRTRHAADISLQPGFVREPAQRIDEFAGVEIGDGKVEVGSGREPNVADLTDRVARVDVVALLDVAGDPMQVVGGIPFISSVVLNDDARIGVCRGSVIVGQGHPAGGGRVEGRSLRCGQIDAGVDHRRCWRGIPHQGSRDCQAAARTRNAG